MADLLIIDSFTDRCFAGNPAAVCLLEQPPETAWCQRLAGEMNLSETCFPVPRDDGDWDLRWFTPRKEVDLCGHATLAAAHALWSRHLVDTETAIRFHTRSGVLSIVRADDGQIEMDFPRTTLAPLEPDDRLYEGLGAMPHSLRLAGWDWLVELPSADDVRYLQPDFRTLGSLPVRGVIVTAAGDEAGIDCVSRFFAPAHGIDEDPVTGSAHCAIGPFWSERLGRQTLTAAQVSQRGGLLQLTIEPERVRIAGRATTTMRGRLVDAALP